MFYFLSLSYLQVYYIVIRVFCLPFSNIFFEKLNIFLKKK
nr:MAG TPA: hypothetical protein [Caudoviricetes sp.]